MGVFDELNGLFQRGEGYQAENSLADDGNARPPRVVFKNLQTRELVSAPYVPNQFTEEVSTNWARLESIGQSHSTLHYVNTDNYALKGIEFYFNAESIQEAEEIHDIRRFLMAACYAPAQAGSIFASAPPRILMVWQQMIRMTFIIENLKIDHQKFNKKGLTTRYVAKMDLTEIRDLRLTSNEVRVVGTKRDEAVFLEIEERRRNRET